MHNMFGLKYLTRIMALKRLFHWGPMLALGIIVLIATETVYCTSMWWPLDSSLGSRLNMLAFFSVAVLTVYNYLSAVFIGPGYVPAHWRPSKVEEEQYLQYCEPCKGYKAPRSHHCRKCGRCVLKMDHHCPWLNNCVGYKNQFHFTMFLFFSVIGSIQSSVLLIITMVKFVQTLRNHRLLYFEMDVKLSLVSFIICVLSIGLAVGVFLALTFLLYIQAKTVLWNMTDLEEWIIEKASERRSLDTTLPPFVYPYDLGWWKNIQQVFSFRKLDNGIFWPVIEGCSQYDFTMEQKQQKILKKMRSAPYKVMYKYSGACFPLTHGLPTLFNPPCSLEDRMPLNPDEIILITRSRRYWMFGEKCASHVHTKCKGWFPRSCVVPYTDYCKNYRSWMFTKESFSTNGCSVTTDDTSLLYSNGSSSSYYSSFPDEPSGKKQT